MKLLKEIKKTKETLIKAGIPENQVEDLIIHGVCVFDGSFKKMNEMKPKMKKLGLEISGSGGGSHGFDWFHIRVAV